MRAVGTQISSSVAAKTRSSSWRSISRPGARFGWRTLAKKGMAISPSGVRYGLENTTRRLKAPEANVRSKRWRRRRRTERPGVSSKASARATAVPRTRSTWGRSRAWAGSTSRPLSTRTRRWASPRCTTPRRRSEPRTSFQRRPLDRGLTPRSHRILPHEATFLSPGR